MTLILLEVVGVFSHKLRAVFLTFLYFKLLFFSTGESLLRKILIIQQFETTLKTIFKSKQAAAPVNTYCNTITHLIHEL